MFWRPLSPFNVKQNSLVYVSIFMVVVSPSVPTYCASMAECQMGALHLLTALLCVFGGGGGGGVDARLVLVQVLYRHGARTPLLLLPGDANNALWWAGAGPGQLTAFGKQNQYELGGFLRRRYADFLHRRYHANYTHVVATDIDRTLMSAAVNLAALYRPHGDQVWNASLDWQPVPVHTRPRHSDVLLRFGDACPAFRTAYADVQRSQRARALERHYAPLLAYLQRHLPGVAVDTLERAGSVYDTLNIESRLNLSVPAWAVAPLVALGGKPVFPDLLQPVADISFQQLGWSRRVRRLGGGQLLARMTTNMLAAATPGQLQPPQRQLFMYSAHDFNVAALLATLGVFNGVAPPLASCVMLELHHSSSLSSDNLSSSIDSDNRLAGYTVRVFYRNSTEQQQQPPAPPLQQQPLALHVPGCASVDCQLTEFLRVTAPVRVLDPLAECGLSAPLTPSPNDHDYQHRQFVIVASAAIMAAGLVVLLATAALWRCCCSRQERGLLRRHRHHRRHRHSFSDSSSGDSDSGSSSSDSVADRRSTHGLSRYMPLPTGTAHS